MTTGSRNTGLLISLTDDWLSCGKSLGELFAYQTEGSAGLDLRVRPEQSYLLEPKEAVVISTGVSVALPVGTVGLVFVRSSIGFKYNTCLTNAVGVIDSDYRGEIKVKLLNHSSEVVEFEPYERIAQLVITPVVKPLIGFVADVSDFSPTDRSVGGFGSTGKV